MNSARERMVERYLDGDMDAAEEREFLQRMKADPSLRRLVEADRALVSGVRKKMAAMPTGAAEPGASLLAKLAATPPTVAAVTGGTIGGALFAGSTIKVLVAAVGVVGIAVGAFVIAPLMQDDTPAANPPTRRSDPPPAVVAPSGTAPTAISPAPAAEDAPAARPRAVAAPSATASKNETPQRAAGHRKPEIEKRAAETELLDEQLSEKPTVFNNDTVKMKVGRRSAPK